MSYYIIGVKMGKTNCEGKNEDNNSCNDNCEEVQTPRDNRTIKVGNSGFIWL